jgi:putative transposase
VADARRDFLHKASTRLVRENDVIAVEDLNVAGMVRNRRLARAISCTGWAEFRSMLEYKARRHGRDVNAAKNILAAGLAAGTRNGANACGGDVRRARATRTRPPVKQEPRPAREGIPVL